MFPLSKKKKIAILANQNYVCVCTYVSTYVDMTKCYPT